MSVVALEIASQAHLATHSSGRIMEGVHAVLTRKVCQTKVMQINVSRDCRGTI
jgi:hypothetical protein